MCLHMHMSSKNVAVQKSVYEALRRERRPGESFTRLFQRLLNQKGPLEDLYGAWGSTRSEKGTLDWRTLRFGTGRRP